MGAQFAMSIDVIGVLRQRAEEQRTAGNQQLASELYAAADAFADLIVELGPSRARQAMARIGEQMRQDHAALRKSMKVAGAARMSREELARKVNLKD